MYSPFLCLTYYDYNVCTVRPYLRALDTKTSWWCPVIRDSGSLVRDICIGKFNSSFSIMPVEPMDNSTHSTTSSSGGGAVQSPPPVSSSAVPTKSTRKQQQTQQLVKLREANAKYKDLLKLAKERIQEQEGVLDDRRCEYFIIWFICMYI